MQILRSVDSGILCSSLPTPVQKVEPLIFVIGCIVQVMTIATRRELCDWPSCSASLP